MKFVKDELTMEVNPAHEVLYLRQGWTPYVGESKLDDTPVDSKAVTDVKETDTVKPQTKKAVTTKRK